MRPLLGKVAYALLFCGAVPAVLAAWSLALDRKFPALPALHSPLFGGAAALAGLALAGRAMLELWRDGGGLPMNAFPPPRLVATGVYRLLPHPIYAGFALAVVGMAIAAGSGAALWIATPAVILATAALVFGYERHDLAARFGARRATTWFAPPESSSSAPTLPQRFAAALGAFLPWLILYQACALLAPLGRQVDTMLPFERRWPVWESTVLAYVGAYVWIAAAPFAVATRAELRRFVTAAWWGTAFIIWCFLVFPFVALPRPAETSGLGALLAWDRALDTPACAFPSFHVFWAFVAAECWRARWGRGADVAAALVAASCLTTGVHSLVDVVAGALVWLAVRERAALWARLRALTERVANSWRDWRLGPVRIINHGAYVAAATVLGLWLVGVQLGAEAAAAIVTAALCSLVGAGLWGQWLEASSQLARPFGYFGGLFAGFAGAAVVEVVWGTGWEVAGAFAVAAPLIQGVGRLRCLVQGCCHGRPAPLPELGIRYHHPLSRVCRLAALDGVPVYPTPLYSLLGNLAILGLLFRLRLEGVDSAFLVGTYLILSTVARFAEEAYRGEPQTARFGGLSLYQWLAIAGLLAGLITTALPAPAPSAFAWSFGPLGYALPLGLLVWFSMGVDFPRSDRRLSRLA